MSSVSSLRTIQSHSVSEQVYETIRDAIINKKLEPGSTVTEAQLASTLGVSKTPVREAFIRLREIGLLQAQHPRGMQVISDDQESIETAWETREVLEAAAVYYAAERAAADDVNAIKSLAQRSLTAALDEDPLAFREADQKLHNRIWQASGNTEIARITENSYTLASALREMREPSPGFSEMCARQHVQ